jgi:carboxylesterase type B
MHQITAFGGLEGPAPFQQAIPQSPGFIPIVSNQQQEQTFQDFLSLLDVKTIEEARKLPFSKLLQANAQQVGASPYGQFTYGPTVDGKFVPALPGELLLHGQYDKSLKIMVGHNADEVSSISSLVTKAANSKLGLALYFAIHPEQHSFQAISTWRAAYDPSISLDR